VKVLLATTRFQCAGGVKILGFLVGGVVDVVEERFFVGGAGGTDVDEDRDILVRTACVGSFADGAIVVNKPLKRLR
jgi:hypothetical protein